MADETTFGDLRAALHRRPSAAAWERVCACLERAPDERELVEIWVPYARAALERWPPRLRVIPPRWRERWRRGARAPYLSVVEALALEERADVRRLAHDAALEGVRLLEINTRNVPADEVWGLLERGSMAGAQRLHLYQRSTSLGARLRHPWVWDHASVEAFYERASARSWRALSVDLDRVEPSGLGALLEHERAAELEHLKLAATRPMALGERARAFAHTTHLGALERLALPRAGLGPEAGHAIARCPSLEVLRVLELGRNPLGDAACAALLEHAATSGVERLGLDHVGFGERAVRALASATRSRLWCLELGGAALQEPEARVLAAARLPALRRLNLSGASLTGRGLELLLDGAWSGGLERLELGGVPLRTPGVLPLCTWEARGLKHLELRGTLMRDDLLALIDQAPWRESIEYLGLGDNGLEDEGVAHLFESSWPALRQLDLSGNHFTGERLEAIAGAQMPNLEILDVSGPLGAHRHDLAVLLERTANLPRFRELRAYVYAR